MSDDLVKRLRSLGNAGPGRISFLASEDAIKAADRIEALEAALTRIVFAEHNAELSSSTMIEMADIALAALGEKKDE